MLARGILRFAGPDVGHDHAQRRVDLLIDGLRYGAVAP